MASVTMQIAKLAKGEKITSFGKQCSKEKDVSVSLWQSGKKKFLLLERAKVFAGYEELPEHTNLSEAVLLQEEKLVCLEGGKA